MRAASTALVAGLLLSSCSSAPEGAKTEKKLVEAPKPVSPYLVYVTNEGSGDLSVLDPQLDKPLETIPLGKRPRGVQFASGKIYVALSGSPSAPPGVDESTLPPPDKSADGIGEVDLGQKKVLRKLFGGSDPEQFAVSADSKLLYVANEDAAGLSVIDIADSKVLTTVKTGEEPEGVRLRPDGKVVYVTSEDEGTISVVDTASNKALTKIKVGRRPRDIAFLPDASKAFVTNENDASVSVLDGNKHKFLRTIEVEKGLKPMGLAITRDGGRLYVSTGRGKKVVVIDTKTEKIVSSFEVGTRPWGIALSPDEKLLFTANGPSNDVTVVDVATEKIVRKIPVGERPWGIVVVAR
jgi:YVTN family beta-propeller protein